MFGRRAPSCSRWIVMLSAFSAALLLSCGARSQRLTDETETQALKRMFERWGIQAPSSWNLSGDPCTGAAVNGSVEFGDHYYKILIKCDSCVNGPCYINQLKVFEQSVTGPIPEELLNLTHLYNLKLDRNYLTGTLPAFIGKLTNLQYLTFGVNALTGPIPKEIGNLTNLITLGLGTNYFNGSLPPEIGKLVGLEQLYIDNSGISGDIPTSFSKLKNLGILWAFSNDFSGGIPDLIGDLSNLTELRLYGNSFQGSLPLSLAKLTKLTELHIGDLRSGSSSLNFIQNLTSLSTLVLRNCKLSGGFPSDLENYTNLKILDLSFNNLIGEIPPSLFKLSSLETLFLGNNSLHGRLPDEKSSSLNIIDVSYNNLTGSLPLWIQERHLQLNLVANNFEINESINSILKGLNCLQKNIPCYDSPICNIFFILLLFPNRYGLSSSMIYMPNDITFKILCLLFFLTFHTIGSSFAINCGGSEVLTSQQLTYDGDNESLTASSYYVAEDKGWAVSNVGIFEDATGNAYIESTSSPITNTATDALFKSSRISPSSLRYHGFGLENGNYSVQLQFAELKIGSTNTYQSLGRRKFDIFIQGTLRERDFDIRQEAGNKSKVAIVKVYNSSVTKNSLEIHLFWAGKGTCCIPAEGTYGPSISAISITPNFNPTVSNQIPSGKKSNVALIVGLVVGLGSVCLSVFTVFLLMRKKLRHSTREDKELLNLAANSNIFSYRELRSATEDFNPRNKLGEGGFGPVFKGLLSDGRSVAVKQLSITSQRGKDQFVTEIETISSIQHRNLVKLYGCCREGDKHLLVYEYLDKGSLNQALFGKANSHLDWPSRFEICLGTARALSYLHEESSFKIVHRDVKTSNILLDSNLKPKISDFGLAKLFDDEQTHISTGVAGTIGYLAPEYALRGHLSEKVDVYGFGVVTLEILSGKPTIKSSLDSENVHLIEQAWHLYENNIELEMIDPTLQSYAKEEALRMIGVALLCTQTSPMLRPPMSRVVKMLLGDIEVGKVVSKPTYLIDLQFEDAKSKSTSIGNFTGSSTAATPGSLASTSSNKVTEMSEPESISLPFIQEGK